MNSLQVQLFDLRKILWTKRHQQVYGQDSFERVKVLSPSLADCLLQRTIQDRKIYLRSIDEDGDLEETDAVENIAFYPTLFGEEEQEQEYGPYIKAALPYLRSSVIGKSVVHLFMQHSSQPRLRRIKIYDDAKVLESKVFLKFGPQLQAFEYNGTLPFVLISTLDDTMSRLQKLKISLWRPPTARSVQPNIERIIPWHQLSAFSLRCLYTRYIFECAQLWDQLGQMIQLRKLSIELTFNVHLLNNRLEHFECEEVKQFFTGKLGIIPKFSKLEVLSFNVHPMGGLEGSSLDYRFLLDLLVPKLGGTLTKLIFHLPYTFQSTSNCIFLDYSNEFPHLETLVLEYRQIDIFPNLYDHQDKRTPSQSIRHLTIANFDGYEFSYSEILKQIPAIFPNLVELNFKLLTLIAGMDCSCRINAKLTDRDLMEMINRLPRLCTLRLADDYPKLRRLLGSIELMCKRAIELKPKVPMLFQVPLGNDFEFIKYSIDQLPDELKYNFYCWDKAAKWIRLC